MLLPSRHTWGLGFGSSDTEQHWTALASTFRSAESWGGQRPWALTSCIQHFVPPDTSVLHLLPKNPVHSRPQEIKLSWVTKDWNCAIPADWEEAWGTKVLLQQTYQPKRLDTPALDSWKSTVDLHFQGGKKKGYNFLYLSKLRRVTSHSLKLSLSPWLPFLQQEMLSQNKSLFRTYPANKNHVKNIHHTEYLLPVVTKYFYKHASLSKRHPTPSYLEWETDSFPVISPQYR